MVKVDEQRADIKELKEKVKIRTKIRDSKSKEIQSIEKKLLQCDEIIEN